MFKKLRMEVYKMNLELPKNKLVTMSSGNVSGRDPKTNYVVIKPSGIEYKNLTPEDLVIVDLTGRIIEGNLKPSIDTQSHLIIYQNRKDINGIVHTHSHYATSFALLNQPIPVYMTAHADEFGDTILVTEYASCELNAVGNAIIKTIKNSSVPAVLVKNHGVFTFGPSATKALKTAVMIEDIAFTYHLALLRGKPDVLPKEEIKKWYKRYHQQYGQNKDTIEK